MINICSRAGALGISNKCMNRSGVWVRNDSNLGTNRLHLDTKRLDMNDRKYETTGYHRKYLDIGVLIILQILNL